VIRLVDIYAGQETPDDLLTLSDEADPFYSLPGRDGEASQFYNLLAQVADRPHLARQRDGLRDRALVGLGRKLRQRSEAETRPGTVVSTLLGRSGQWSAAVVSDAEFAFKAAVGEGTRATARDAPEVNRLRLHEGTVTAVCFAPEGNLLFLGFADGTLAAFTPGSSTQPFIRPMLSSFLTRGPGTIVALATEANGSSTVAVLEGRHGERALRRYVRDVMNPNSLRFTLGHNRPLAGSNCCSLSPVMRIDGGPVVALRDGENVQILTGPVLMPVAERALSLQPEDSLTMAWHSVFSPGGGLLVGEGASIRRFSIPDDGEDFLLARWSPALPADSTLRSPAVSCLHKEEGRMEMAALGQSGMVCWSEIGPGEDHPVTTELRWPPSLWAYRAVTLVGRGQIATVTERGVDWLRASGKTLTTTATTWAKLPDAVACFFCGGTNELLVVCARGDIVRIPKPQ
jgi:hypothetical protein